MRRWIRGEIERVIGCDGFDESMVDYVIHADSSTLKKYVTSLFEDESAASKFCEEFRRRNVVDGFQDGKEKSEDKDLTQFKILTGSDDATAKYYLGKMRLQDAVNAFFETRGSEIVTKRNEIASKTSTTDQTLSRNVTTTDTASVTSRPLNRNVTTTDTSRSRRTRYKSKRTKNTKDGKHDWYDCTCRVLLTNCLNCGKIICKNEGMGPCGFCGEPLDHVYIQRSQRDGKGSGAFSTRRDRQNAKALREQEEKIKAAERTKQRLLHYDRTGAERSRVFDDQADYYSMKDSQWLSTAERARARKKDTKNQRKTSRRKKKKTVFDLRSKKMIEIDATSSEESDDSDVFQRNRNDDDDGEEEEGTGSGMFNNTTLSGRMKEIYDHIVDKAKDRRRLRRAQEDNDETKEKKQDGMRTRLQHSVHNGPSHKLTLSEDKRDVLDLYPTISTTTPRNGVRATKSSSSSSLPELIRNGVVLIRGFLSSSEQQHFVDVSRKLGMKRSGGFYIPHYEGGGRQRCAMMCLGKHWNPVRGMYESTRSNFDNAPVPSVPKSFLPLVRKAVNAAWSCDRSVWPKRKNAAIEMIPQLCIVNFYTDAGRMGMHQDKHEAPYVLQQQIPIVSFSVGDDADFEISSDLSEEKRQVVRLCSGDCLVFGGMSRMIYHGISKVHRRTAPDWLKMRPGRLNLTFRQYDR